MLHHPCTRALVLCAGLLVALMRAVVSQGHPGIHQPQAAYVVRSAYWHVEMCAPQALNYGVLVDT